MKNTTICFIGVDISKDKLDIYYHPQNLYQQITNAEKAIKQFLKEVKKMPEKIRLTCEATGGYEKKLLRAAHAEEISIGVANPRCVRNFAKALGLLAKTDRLDAKVIALFEEKVGTRTQLKPYESQEDLAAYRKRRKQLTDMITMEKNRLESANQAVRKIIERVIRILEKELRALDELIDKCIEEDPKLREKSKRLQSCKGIGKVVSMTLLANLPELGEFNRGTLANLVGVAPLNCDSGKQQGKRKTWGGRSAVRSTLYMGTLVAIKWNKPIKELYERHLAAGKAKKVALVACMRRLLITLNNMIKNKTDWSENYYQKCQNLG